MYKVDITWNRRLVFQTFVSRFWDFQRTSTLIYVSQMNWSEYISITSWIRDKYTFIGDEYLWVDAYYVLEIRFISSKRGTSLT